MSARAISIIGRRYGWRPDLPDQRDYRLILPSAVLPSSVDLRPSMPLVYDQGDLGSCTGNGIAGAIEYARRKQALADFVPSRLFIYYNERVIEGTVTSDAGASIRDGIQTVSSQGACPESEWPYDVSKFAALPPAQCYTDAKLDLVSSYARVDQTVDQMRTCLAAKIPVVFGFTVYESFESAAVASSGIVPMPATNEAVLGGHCTVLSGYDDENKRFLVRNSWGESWGLDGYFWFPYDYAASTDLSSDFWEIEAVTVSGATVAAMGARLPQAALGL